MYKEIHKLNNEMNKNYINKNKNSTLIEMENVYKSKKVNINVKKCTLISQFVYFSHLYTYIYTFSELF